MCGVSQWRKRRRDTSAPLSASSSCSGVSGRRIESEYYANPTRLIGMLRSCRDDVLHQRDAQMCPGCRMKAGKATWAEGIYLAADSEVDQDLENLQYSSFAIEVENHG
jgi:hypothetical protein